jgi:hypothetical protein
MESWPGKKQIGKTVKMLTAAAGITLGAAGLTEAKSQTVAPTDSIELQQEKKETIDRFQTVILRDIKKGFSWKNDSTTAEILNVLSKPYAKEVFDSIFERAKLPPGKYPVDLPEEESMEKTADFFVLTENIELIKKQPFAEEFIKKMINEPFYFHSIISHANQFIDQPYALRVIENGIENYQGYGLEYLLKSVWNDKNLEMLLLKSEKPSIRKIVEITQYLGQNNKIQSNIVDVGRIFALLDEMVDGNLSVSEGVQLAYISKEGKAIENTKYFEHLFKIKNKQKYLMPAQVTFMFEKAALYEVGNINSLHEYSDLERFKSVEGYNSKMLYTLMAYSEEEIFTSSFNGLFNRLLEKIKSEGKTGDVLLEEVRFDKFRTFIKECASFNRLDEFLGTMPRQKQEVLLQKFVQGIEKEAEMLAQATTVADVFGTLEDSTTLEIFQKTIKEEYERCERENSKEGTVMYGLLAGLFGEKAIIDEGWIKQMSEKYKLENLSEIKSKELFNPDGTNIQQYFFYDDEDGVNSFKSFMFQYEHKRDWKVEKTDTYVHITSVGTGKKVEIYANFPESEFDGPDDIEEKLSEREVKSIVVVHRGHSYHAQETIDRITPIAKIVWLGSCGGYNNMSEVLEKSPTAHIISTKGTGTMKVNDPLLKMLNTDLLTGRDINWNEFWQKAELKLGDNKDFENYVPPNKNLGALFLKAYNKLVSTEK